MTELQQLIATADYHQLRSMRAEVEMFIKSKPTLKDMLQAVAVTNAIDDRLAAIGFRFGSQLL